MTSLTVSSKHQIVIPKASRKRWGIGGGDKLIAIDTEQGILIRKQAEPELSIYDFVGIAGPSKGDPVKRIRAIRDADD